MTRGTILLFSDHSRTRSCDFNELVVRPFPASKGEAPVKHHTKGYHRLKDVGAPGAMRDRFQKFFELKISVPMPVDASCG